MSGQKRVEKKKEACNQKLEMNQPVFLLGWAFYKPVIMLEEREIDRERESERERERERERET